jgi:hypothetical protein
MSDYGMMPDDWTSEDLAAQRESLAQLAGTARAEDLPRLANIVDLLDVLDAVNAGTVTADEARDAMRATHKEVLPSRGSLGTPPNRTMWGGDGRCTPPTSPRNISPRCCRWSGRRWGR